MRKKWLARLPRKTASGKYDPSCHAKLCEIHFLPSDFKEERGDKTRGRAKKRGTLVRKYLKPGVIPSIWPNLPLHLSKEPPPPKPTTMATSSSREMMDNLREQEEQHEAQERDSFNSLSELEEKFSLNDVPVDAIIKKENYFLFLSTKSEEKPEIKYAMKSSENLTVELHCDGLPLKRKQIDDIKDLPEKLSSFSLLVNVLVALEKMYEGKFRENIEEEELIEEVIKLLKNSRLYDNKRIAFLTEQLMLAVLSPRQRRYSSSLLAMSVMWFKISPTAYKHVYQEGILTLPTERRIQQLTSAADVDLKLDDSTKAYLKARISKLHLKDLYVALLVDEVYSSRQVQYSHGRFYGNENGEITETLLCFMIKSVAGKYRDVVAMIPISNLTADKQYTAWYTTASALTEIGFDIVLTMTDGNNVNHTFFSKICGKMRKALKTSIDSPFSGSKMFVASILLICSNVFLRIL